MSQIKAIVSDADGTLVNTMFLIRHGQYEAAAEYLHHIGVPAISIPNYEVYESYINRSVGGSTLETFKRTLQLIYHSNPELLERVNLNELNDSLTAVQDRIAPLYVHPYHGLTELLSWTGKAQIKFGIFTSGSRHHVVRNFGVSLPVMGYTELFQTNHSTIDERFNAFITRAEAVYGMPQLAVVTCENVIKTKPDPEGILKLMQILQVKPDEVIVLGDLPVDMQAAQRAGVHPIGVIHGFGSPAELTEAGAIKIIENLTTLPKLIEKHNSGIEELF